MEYFEDYNFRPTQRSAKMGRFETGSEGYLISRIYYILLLELKPYELLWKKWLNL